MLAQAVGLWDIIVVLIYLLLVVYLGILGYMRTKSAADYLIAGRQVHPFVMAMSYGATFISTSAIVGFGGVAGLFGMSLLWLTFCNIFVGIFLAFVFIAPRTRMMGHHLDAHTFPEFLGRRFESRFIQVFAGTVIFLFIPLYAAAVLIGGSVFVAKSFNMEYPTALLLFSVIIAAYVIVGGLKGVMYSDALQGSIMFIGMFALLIYGYVKVGGVIEGHQKLSALAPLVPGKLSAIGHRGWTAMPAFGWGDRQYDLWWTVIGTIVLGVGIGVLAQPQLVVRFMTVKSRRELNRAVLIGGVFILVMTGVAFTVGALSNAYFSEHGAPLSGRVVKMLDAEKGLGVLQIMKKGDTGVWADVPEKIAPVKLFGQAVDRTEIDGQPVEIRQGRSISIVYAGGTADEIIPTYIVSAMPKWFGLLFLLTLLSAAMSTLSSQFHTVGTSIGRDVYEQITGAHGASTNITRIGIIIGIIYAVIISFYARESTFIARATSIFFGLCASAFLPSLLGAIYFRRMTKAGAIWSMLIGFIITAFWLLLVKAKEAESMRLVQWITGGKTSILADCPNWDVVDPLLVALPVSFLAAIVVSALTQPPSKEHLDKCFKGI
ncbi:MAG TPA: sodium:solute symporter family protein [Anaerohalosphaeraceae bacterium]|nr:sodium:solute symporter family protein [Anaerohalosphaeraceae bacterium]HPC64919.1 sodium:solute symporter family protein [Anaerohalosphaeraceae bacterium]HPO70018.1 sodium:solute symporter family protein [Anaerohalosphaeraceae bacterium]HRS70654.1 sodium:solute symporter family protein [Anaerohalosphaeraceae bacterium]HRV20422.1 sodium:solute symporter family protein [Anaerohalosphaeraceae bacterium]